MVFQIVRLPQVYMSLAKIETTTERAMLLIVVWSGGREGFIEKLNLIQMFNDRKEESR